MDNKLWNNNVDEISKGYKQYFDKYECLFCHKTYNVGEIYNEDNKLFDAYGAINNHINTVHGDTVEYFLNEEISLLGISEVQKQIIRLMIDGKNDKEISKSIGIAQSTVRNHRFKLREKEKQAKLFLAFMKALENRTTKAINVTDNGVIEELHQSATMIDYRYNITDKDREKTVKAYIDENGAIKQFPSKEKKKIIILGEIMKNFDKNYEYSEKEVNRILQRMYDDYVTLRRALVEYGFLDRADDCSVYRVKE